MQIRVKKSVVNKFCHRNLIKFKLKKKMMQKVLQVLISGIIKLVVVGKMLS